MKPRSPQWVIWTVAILTAAALSACTHGTEAHEHGRLTLEQGEVRISIPNAADAYVQRSGGLLIGTRAIPLSTAEHNLARRYYRDTLGIANAGEATGKAGGKLGLSIVGSLFSALWHGDASNVDRTAQAGAARIKARVKALCNELADLERTQDALAAAQPAFAPYRVVGHAEVHQCRRSVERHEQTPH